MTTTTTKTYKGQIPIALPDDATPEWVSVPIEFASSAYAANDMIMLCKLPIGMRVLDWMLNFPDIDSGSAAFASSLGVALNDETDLSAEVWASGITAGQSTTLVRATTSVATQYDPAGISTQFPAASVGPSTSRKVALKVTTAAATYAGSGKTGYLLMLLQA